MPTDKVAHPWAIRSAVVAVSDLDRSVAFYQDLGPFDEIDREDAVAVLGGVSPASVAMILRETRDIHHARYGQQSLGLRSMTFNVGSLDELDRIESVLRGRDLFSSRQQIAGGVSELVRGRIRTTCPWCSPSTHKTERSDPTITEQLSVWLIRWTPDPTLWCRGGGTWLGRRHTNSNARDFSREHRTGTIGSELDFMSSG